jgi:polyisoprenoid-binding protein YceI
MKCLLLAATALVMLSGPAFAAAETYNFDPNHTNILWHANHFGFSNPSGHFAIKEGSVTLDEASPANSSVNVTIDVKSLATGIPQFDDHLKAEGFLNADKFPEATFKSTKVEVAEGGQAAKVLGDLTLHGVTKPVTLDVKLNKIGENPMNKKKSAGFSATTTIKRSDFGIDKYVPAVSDELQIGIEAEAAVQ